ncbi:response regulator [bacterium]|nr:MAG: response regulator [bacterium]
MGFPQSGVGSKFGVLVVEDNPDDEALTLRALRHCGLPLTVTIARNGAEAVEVLSGDLTALGLRDVPRLALIDLKLPKLSGLEVLAFVRSFPDTATMPVVCLTSSDESVDTAQAYALGANSFVRKPIDYDAYLEVVSKAAEYWLRVNYWPA